jgi:hypothetical protein
MLVEKKSVCTIIIGMTTVRDYAIGGKAMACKAKETMTSRPVHFSLLLVLQVISSLRSA